MWFMHDREGPHFLGIVRHHLNHIFSEQWISPVIWLWPSPEFNTLDFQLWRHLKTGVCSANQWLGHIKQQARNACQEIPVKPGIFYRVCTSLQERADNRVGNVCEPHRASALDITDTAIYRVSLQFEKCITKPNEKADKWKLLEHETYIFKFFFLTPFNTPLYGHH
jgi:hypothetical protein